MGTEFFLVYDITIVVIVIASIFAGVKKGFIRILAGLLSLVIAFSFSLFLSGIVTDYVYETLIEDKIKETIDENFSNIIDMNTLDKINKLDTSKIKVNGKTVNSIDTTPDNVGNVTLDLSQVDISGMGIDGNQLAELGLDSNDLIYSNIKLGKVIINPKDLENKNVGDYVFAHVVASQLPTTDLLNSITDIAQMTKDVVPSIFTSKLEEADEISSNNNTIFTEVVYNLIFSNGDYGEKLLDNMVKPFVVIPLHSILFAIIMGICMLIFTIIISQLSVLNKVPIVGGINSFLGGVAGGVKGAVWVFIICLLVRFIVQVTNNSLIFLNEQTIEGSFLFDYIYKLKFLIF